MRSVKVGIIAMFIASLYLLVPYSSGRKCLGMACLEYAIASIPIALIGWPWSQLAYKIPPTSDVKSKGIYRGSALQRGYWLRISGFISAYLLNVFIIFSGFHYVITGFRRRKLKNRDRST